MQNKIRLEAAKNPSLLLWRNNVGEGWQGVMTRKEDTVLLTGARVLHAGLCKGSSDLIGIRSVLITQEMVGQTLGQFLAIEVKIPGKTVSKDQRHFLATVEKYGGTTLVARSVGDVWRI